MKENGLMIICTDMVHSAGQGGKNIKEIIYLINKMERESFIGLMEENIKDNGEKEKCTERE